MFKNKSLNQESIDSFLDAISKSNTAAVSMMLSCTHDKGLLVNSTKHGVSALSMAAGLGNEEICQILLSSGAIDFDEAYDIATKKGHSEIAGMIMKQNFKHAGEKMRNFEVCFKYGLFLFSLITSAAVYIARNHTGDGYINNFPRVM